MSLFNMKVSNIIVAAIEEHSMEEEAKMPRESEVVPMPDCPFGLCHHYAYLLHEAETNGFDSVKWASGFTLMHLAAKRNNLKLMEHLSHICPQHIHAIDDFGHKPIDYTTTKKKESVYGFLMGLMCATKVKMTAAEEMYQMKKTEFRAVKPTVSPKKPKDLSYKDIMNDANIADGDNPPADAKIRDHTTGMTLLEVAMQVPDDYKKAIKKLDNGGWKVMQDQWPQHDGRMNHSLLHWAARHGKDEICQFLVCDMGANPDDEDGCGKSAIEHAKLKHHRKLAKMLFGRFKEGWCPKKAKAKTERMAKAAAKGDVKPAVVVAPKLPRLGGA